MPTTRDIYFFERFFTILISRAVQLSLYDITVRLTAHCFIKSAMTAIARPALCRASIFQGITLAVQ